MSPSGKRSPAELRRIAEAKVATRGRRAERPEDTARLLHELDVHRIELELQNEELVASRHEVEAGLQRYTELFDFAPLGYVVLDGHGRIREANLEASRMLGVERAALMGCPLERFVAADDRSSWHEQLRDALAAHGGGPQTFTRDVGLARMKDGKLDVRFSAAAVSGTEPRVVVAIHDVTARKNAERALREENARRDEFMAALSHELRNPLAPVRSSLAVLARAKPGGKEARQAMEIIDRQIDYLVHIVDDLLDVTRIARGKVPLTREPLELGALVRQCVDDHRQSFVDMGISLAAAGASAPVWVDGDATRLVQVVGNLLGNALKFTGEGGRVHVEVRRERDEGVLSVRDDGIGMTADTLGHLFEPFTQAPQTLERKQGGLGLGLAMVKGLVELHGGNVVATSSGTGRGSEFTVHLPLTEARNAAVESPAPRERAAGRRVLVVDDNHDSADALRDLLEIDGHEACVAYDGPSAIVVAHDFRPEVVFCDIGLPEVDGYEVARRMRADAALAGSTLVALSGYARPEDRRRSAEAGFDFHLAKPPSMEAIERLLRSPDGG